MKVQNTVTLEQAQALDKAIREAGLEWPGIEWEWGIWKWHQVLNGKEVIGVFRNHDINAHNLGAAPAFQFTYQDIPAPNLAELAMMVPNYAALRLDQVTVDGMLKILMGFFGAYRGSLITHWEGMK